MTDKILNVIGNPLNHDQQAFKIVSGRLDFAADRLPGIKFYGAIKSSAIAHGKIIGFNFSRALAEPGVKSVITYKECPVWSPDIFQWGQEVAGVVASDTAAATRAAALIEIKYEELKAIVDPEEAMKPDAVLAGTRPDTNTDTPTNLVRGKGGPAGLLRADVILQTQQPWSATYQHQTLETHSAVSWWIGEDLYVWCGTQSPFNARYEISKALNMPTNRIHVFTHGTGGALGDKNTNGISVVAGCMSRSVKGHPVQVVLSRHDNMLFNTRQFAVKSAINIGTTREGLLTGIDAHFTGDAGRNPTAPIRDVHFGLRTTYTCPDASFTVTRVSTNTPQRGFWRCVNDPPGAVNYDVALDKMATRLDIDPFTFRMLNLRPSIAPDQDPPNLVWSGNGIALCFDKVLKESGYRAKWHKPGTRKLQDGRWHGISITGHLDSHGSISIYPRGAILTITSDGKCLINVGGARASDGPITVCAHIAAETLGMKYEDVSCGEWGNTDVSLDAGMQAGSTFTAGAGSAFYNAALDARAKVFTAALSKSVFREISGISVSDLDASNGEIFYVKNPSIKITYRQAMSGTIPIAGLGSSWLPMMRSRSVGSVPIGSACNSNGSAATCAEVAVDPESGEVEILGIWNGVDSGRTIFKQGAIKEMNSGCELQIFQALFAGDIYDLPSGACISSDYLNAMFPTSLDFKTERFNVYDLESNDAAGPYGAHGIAEPCVTNYSCIICAIFNATGAWVDTDQGPCTPNKILKAMGKA